MIVGSAYVLYLTKMIDLQAYKENVIIFDAMLGVRCATKLATDGYMFTEFIRLFNFFIEKKREAVKDMHGDDAELTPYNQLVIYMTLFLWGLNILYSLSVAVVWSLYQSSII